MSRLTASDINGFRFAWWPATRVPHVVRIDGNLWLPIFRTVDELIACMKDYNVEGYLIAVLDDAQEVLVALAKSGVAGACTNLRHENGRDLFSPVTLGQH